MIGDLDVLYMTRVQKERFFNEDDYLRLRDTYILDEEKLQLAKPSMAVLHPLPRVNEIAVDVDDDPRAAYFEQVKNGMLVRMALESTVVGDELPGYEPLNPKEVQPDGSHQHSERHHYRPCAGRNLAEGSRIPENRPGQNQACAHHERRLQALRLQGHHQNRR